VNKGHLLRGRRGAGVGVAGALALLAVALPLPAADIATILKPTTDFSKPESFERNPGGATTPKELHGKNAFSQPAANLSLEERADFFIGNGLFKRLWVIAPSSTQAADGLGPLYNARSCQRCHLKDGRGHPPAGPDDSAVSMFLRLSVPPDGADVQQDATARRESVVPEPTYGTQLQDLAIPGHKAEGRMVIDYEEVPVELASGEVVNLRKPTYSVADLGYGPMDPDVMLSPRVAQPMIGLGLLEAIPEEQILAHADPDDRDGDGISGRPNQVWSEQHDRPMLGRFGWKAGQPTLLQQSSSALAGDIGVSNPLAPFPWGECTEAETDCRTAPDGNSEQYENLEAPSALMKKILFYVRHLAVPARRDLYEAQTLHGKELFYEAGCIACHVPKFVTSRDAAEPALQHQLIWPYTDLLLHDMGEGLADHRPEGLADGREWRTQPLWGIGLTETVNGHTYFLHDGRARNLTEAILWHGGEAQASRDRFAAMTKEEREALIAFVNSL
jgi:CxxC motif-containing protein (DUF1111 family)